MKYTIFCENERKEMITSKLCCPNDETHEILLFDFDATRNKEMHLKLNELQTQIAQQKEEIKAMNEQITELRYRPSGPGFCEAKEHYEELSKGYFSF